MSPRPTQNPVLPERAEQFLERTDPTEFPNTYRTYRSSLGRLQAFAVEKGLTSPTAPLPVSAWQPETLKLYYRWLKANPHGREGKYRADTIRKNLFVAQSYVDWLAGDDLLPDANLVIKIKAKLRAEVGSRSTNLTHEPRLPDETIGALLNYYHTQLVGLTEAKNLRQKRLILLRNQALLQVLYATAGRAAEVRQLTRADVEDGKADSAFVKGKRKKRRELFFTEASQRAIQRYLEARDEAREEAGLGDESATWGLFISHSTADPGRRLSTTTMWKIVNDAAAAVFGKDKKGHPRRRVGPHAFRHLRAQHLVDEGIPLEVLQTMLGHADISTTRRIYAPKTRRSVVQDAVASFGLNPDDVARAAQEKLDRKRAAGRRAHKTEGG